MPFKTIKPVRTKESDYDKIEARLRKHFKEKIYQPLMDIISKGSGKNIKLKNSLSPLEDAIATGRLIYHRGYFKGRTSARVTSELRDLGATWERSKKAWRLPINKAPNFIKQAVAVSEKRLEETVKSLDQKIAQILPEEISDSVSFSDLIDTSIHDMDRDLKKSLKDISIVPEFTKEQLERISTDYTQNMQKWIRDWTAEEIVKLREAVQKQTLTGVRYDSLAKTIEASYGVSKSKAKFLARQETHLYMVAIKKERYLDAGVSKYKWQTVVGSSKHPVRPMHKRLDGKIFDWNNPPITDEKGNRNHPGQDYNCIVGDTVVEFNSKVLRRFKRFYEGSIVKLTSESGLNISITPNHPVLTTVGWVFAKDINPSHKLLKRINGNLVDFLSTEVNHGVSTANEIDNFLRVVSFKEGVPRSQIKLHGELIGDHEVDVVAVNGELFDGVNAFAGQKIKNKLFASPDHALVLESVNSAFSEFLLGTLNTPYSIVSFSDLLDPLGASHSIPLDLFRFRLTSDAYSGLKQAASNNISGYAKEFCDAILALKFDSIHFDDSTSVEVYSIPGMLSFFTADSIVDVCNDNYSGEVFNYETLSGTYIANGFALGNCRCVPIPIVEF